MAAPKKTLVIIAFAALYVIWGSTYLGIRFAIETIPPFLMAGARFVAAGLIMYVIAWAQGISKSTWANWRTSLIIGACLLLAGNGGVTISEQHIDSGLALYDEQRHAHHRFLYLGHDPAVCGLAIASQLCSALGYAAQAKDRGDQALALAA